MSGGELEIFIVVLRESVEALLVLAILSACIGRMPADVAAISRRGLAAGVGAGLAISAALAYVILRMSELLEGDALDLFQAAMILSAACLMLQTAFWIGRRAELETHHSNRYGAAAMVAGLCALAIAREGSETVVFVYGVLAAADASPHLSAAIAAAGALLTSIALFVLFQFSTRSVARRAFFRLSELLLFVVAGSLVMSGIDRLIAVGLVPTLSRPLWDTSWLLDESGLFGGLLSALAGYRARPELIVIVVLAAYWGSIVLLLRLRNSKVPAR